MNARIVELLKASSRQVDASVGTTSEFGWITESFEPEWVTEVDYVKFALSVVNECLTIVDAVDMSTDHSSDPKVAIALIGYGIAKRFGLE